MQTQNRLFDDLARVASGAFHTLGGLREEIELRVKERIERMANEMDLVSREEFDAVSEMAMRARTEQEAMAKRIEALEAQIESMTKEPAPRKRATTRKAKTAGKSDGGTGSKPEG